MKQVGRDSKWNWTKMIQLKDYRVEKKQMPSELTLRQWIRESPVKSQENPLEKQIAIFFLVKVLPWAIC